MRKKFRIRVKYYYKGHYIVQYAWYRFLPNWRPLLYWFDQGHPGGTECWTKNLMSMEHAEIVAGRIQSIEDVAKYYEPHRADAKAWKKAEAEWWKKKAPYLTKEIKH